MPLLGPDDLLPSRPQRVLVNGTSGSGKSTLARLIGEQLDLPYTELDSLFHGLGWVPRETFREDVDRFSSQDRWVTEFQYDPVRPMLAERADLFVWLDLPRRLVMMRLLRRTLSRRWRRTALWNGEREAPLHTFFTDPEHVVRYAWRGHGSTRERAHAVMQTHPDLVVVRLRSAREVVRWLDIALPQARAGKS
jgi:adenylate kinase family enzyme